MAASREPHVNAETGHAVSVRLVSITLTETSLRKRLSSGGRCGVDFNFRSAGGAVRDVDNAGDASRRRIQVIRKGYAAGAEKSEQRRVCIAHLGENQIRA